MSNFVVIGGFPVVVTKASQDTDNVGGVTINRSGEVVDARLYPHFEGTYETEPLLPEDATALQALLQGVGHVVRFDGGFESFGGLGPDFDTYDLRFRLTSGRWGGAVELQSGSALPYLIGFGDEWTAMVTIRDANDATDVYETFCLRSDGSEWKDGEAGSHSIANFLAVDDATGTLTLSSNDKSGVATDLLVDEIAMFKFYMSDDMCALLSEGTEPLPRLPMSLTLYGEQVPGFAGLEVVPKNVEVKYMQGHKGDAWQNALRVVRFDVRGADEVEIERGTVPVAYWTFDADDVDGATAYDYLGTSDATTSTDAVAGVDEGRFGFGESLTPNGYFALSTSSVAALNITGDLTICAWVKLNALPTGTRATIAYKQATFAGGASPYGLYVTTAGKLEFEHVDGVPTTESFTSTEDVPVGEWFFAVVRRESGNVELRVNARRDPAGATAAAVTPTTNILGVQMGSSTFDGHVDEVAVIDGAETDDVIAGLYFASRRGEHYGVNG